MLKGGYSYFTYISKMRKEIQMCANRNKVRMKVVEKIECSIHRELQRSDVFGRKSCGRRDCVMCKLESGFNCRTRVCVYQLKCAEFERKYRGQTGNSGYERGNQHFDEWKRRLERCPLHRRSQFYNAGRESI